MKIQRKPNSTKRLPVPLENHTSIEDWMKRVMPGLQPLVACLDELICSNIPGLQYAIKWGKVYYGLPELGWIIELVAYDVSVNVVFLSGAEFDSPPPQGDGDQSRYIKLKTLDEVNRPDIQKWIQQASRVSGWI